jgi:VCBS repeat-containing protein
MANSVPTLTGLTTPVAFLENTVNAAPQIIDGDVTFTDPDNNFDGGRLTVAGLLAQDTVAIRNQGTGTGEIGVSGSNVSFGGSVIGSFAGGAGSTLTVTFNAAATAAGIEALIENLTYANSSDAPAASRSFELKVTDAAGFAATIAPLAEQTGAANPFNGVDVGIRSTPSFADLDGDGDLDAAVGEYNGILHYFENTGSATAPAFTARTGAANPFDGVDVGTASAPSFADLDGDGDLDAVVGANDGTLRYFENTGSATAPAFTARTGAANPFNGVTVGIFSTPSFADLDGDGDLDAVVGANDGTLGYVENTGSALAPAFAERTGAANPFNGVNVGDESTPSFADLDSDGDPDAIVGERFGTLLYFENTGTAIAPAFIARTGAANPFNGVDVGFTSTPSFADLDGDGELDAVVGANDGTVHYFLNTTPPAPDFAEQTGAANPFNTVDVGAFSTPSFADLDGDGDLDAVVGEFGGNLHYFENTGSAIAPAFTEQTGAANPFNGVNVGPISTPSFADLDGDGDLDAVVGEFGGTLRYFENTGSAIAPAFTARTGAANPFDTVDVGDFSKPSFADLDGDGDLDAVVGTLGGTLRYFENTGSATAPAFTARTGVANPFDGVDVGTASAPSFADLDGDGDLDAVIGEQDGNLNYFRNTGAGFTLVVDVTAQNDAAALSADVRNLTETNAAADISSSGTLTISDVDSPTTFVAQAGTVGLYGTFAINTAGAWTYTASSAHDEFAAGTTYTDTFPVAGSDGTLTSVTINIAGSNDAATLSADVRDLTEANTAAAISSSGTLTITDPDNAASFVAQAGTAGLYGTFAIDTAGAWTYAASSAHNEFAAGTTYTDTFSVASSDGTPTSVTVNIVGSNDTPVANAQSLGTDKDTAVAVMLSGSDVDGDSLAFAVLSGPAHGTLSGSGANRTYTPDPGYLGPDSFSYVANDGTLDSAAASVSLNVHLNIAPVVTAFDQSATRGQVFNASDLFSATDGDGDTLLYFFYDNSADPGSGHFTVNGVVQAANTTFAVNAAQLAQTTFTAGSRLSDDLYVNAWDGVSYSGPQQFHINVPANHAPTATASDQSATRGQVFNASSLFSASDGDGDSLLYFFYDNSAEPASGHFTVNGVVQAANTTFAVAASQLGSTTFTAGQLPDDLFVNAWDGSLYSGPKEFHVNVPANQAPTVTAPDFSASKGQIVNASDLFTANDANGDPLLYFFYDNSAAATSGHFTVNGVVQAAGTTFAVSAAQLAQTTFTAGTAGADDLFVNAWDGVAFSGPKEFHVNVVDNAPTVTAPNQTPSSGQILNASSLFSANDADGDSLLYFFYDNNAAATSGHFEINGVTQAANTTFAVGQTQLAQTTFVAGTTGDDLFVNAWDGHNFSGPKEFHIDIV